MIFFDQTKEREQSFEGEAVRLYNELKPRSARTFINEEGQRIDIPEKKGFDANTATITDMTKYLADTRIKKSQSMIAFIHRIMSMIFPTEYANLKDKIDNRFKLEHELIQSHSKNDVVWLGEVGFQNMVRLDGSLTNPRSKIIKLQNGEVRSVGK